MSEVMMGAHEELIQEKSNNPKSKELLSVAIESALDFVSQHSDWDVDMHPEVNEPVKENIYATYNGSLTREIVDPGGQKMRKKVYLLWEKGFESAGPIRVTSRPEKFTDELRDLS